MRRPRSPAMTSGAGTGQLLQLASQYLPHTRQRASGALATVDDVGRGDENLVEDEHPNTWMLVLLTCLLQPLARHGLPQRVKDGLRLDANALLNVPRVLNRSIDGALLARLQ